jgi:hypothetical protein
MSAEYASARTNHEMEIQEPDLVKKELVAKLCRGRDSRPLNARSPELSSPLNQRASSASAEKRSISFRE